MRLLRVAVVLACALLATSWARDHDILQGTEKTIDKATGALHAAKDGLKSAQAKTASAAETASINAKTGAQTAQAKATEAAQSAREALNTATDYIQRESQTSQELKGMDRLKTRLGLQDVPNPTIRDRVNTQLAKAQELVRQGSLDAREAYESLEARLAEESLEPSTFDRLKQALGLQQPNTRQRLEAEGAKLREQASHLIETSQSQAVFLRDAAVSLAGRATEAAHEAKIEAEKQAAHAQKHGLREKLGLKKPTATLRDQATEQAEALRDSAESIATRLSAQADTWGSRLSSAMSEMTDFSGDQLTKARAALADTSDDIRQYSRDLYHQAKEQMQPSDASSSYLQQLEYSLGLAEAPHATVRDHIDAGLSASKDGLATASEHLSAEGKVLGDRLQKAAHVAKEKSKVLGASAAEHAQEWSESLKSTAHKASAKLQATAAHVQEATGEAMDKARAHAAEAKAQAADARAKAGKHGEEIKQNAESAWQSAKATGHEAAEDLSARASNLGTQPTWWQQTQHYLFGTPLRTEQAWHDARSKASEGWQATRENAGHVADQARERWADVKDKAASGWDTASGQARRTADQATDSLRAARQTAGEKLEDIEATGTAYTEKARHGAESAANKAQHAAQRAASAGQQAGATATNKLREAVDQVKENKYSEQVHFTTHPDTWHDMRGLVDGMLEGTHQRGQKVADEVKAQTHHLADKAGAVYHRGKEGASEAVRKLHAGVKEVPPIAENESQRVRQAVVQGTQQVKAGAQNLSAGTRKAIANSELEDAYQQAASALKSMSDLSGNIEKSLCEHAPTKTTQLHRQIHRHFDSVDASARDALKQLGKKRDNLVKSTRSLSDDARERMESEKQRFLETSRDFVEMMGSAQQALKAETDRIVGTDCTLWEKGQELSEDFLDRLSDLMDDCYHSMQDYTERAAAQLKQTVSLH